MKGNSKTSSNFKSIVKSFKAFSPVNCLSVEKYDQTKTSVENKDLVNEIIIDKVETEIFKILQSPHRRFNVDIGNNLNIWTLAVNTHFDNTPIVLIHGYCAGIGVWRYNIDALSESRPLYAIDLLGFGRSSRPNFSKNPLEAENQFVDSIEEWRKRMKIDKFILLGHSFGAYLSTCYSLKYPKFVKALILNDCWGFNDSTTEKSFSQIKNYIRSTFKTISTSFQFTPDPVYNEESNLNYKYFYYCNYVKKASGKKAFDSLLNINLYLTSKYPLIHRIHKLDKDLPVWFLHGENSWIQPSASYKIAELRKNFNTSVLIIKNAGHNIHADNPYEFNIYVQTILDLFRKEEEKEVSKPVFY